jgi:tetratricopeptide (TPR) repeat protein
MKFVPVASRTLGLVLAAILLSGCSRDPNVRKQKYLESGQRYFEKAKYREAVIQFSNAIQVDPRFADAHYHLAQAYLKLQQWTPAYQELDRTLQFQPDNYHAHLDMANLLITGGDLGQAQGHTDFLREREPNSPEVHAAIASLLTAQQDVPAAIQEMRLAVAESPGRWELYQNLAILQVKADQPNAAEANFTKAEQLNPKAMDVQMALGSFYQSHGRTSDAQQHFEQAIANDPNNPVPRAAFAQLYMELGKEEQAEELLKHAKNDFPENSAGYRMLGDLYFATRDLEKATTEYASLNKQHPQDSQVKKNYIQLLILKDRLDEARKLDDEVLKSNPSDVDALIYRGQICIGTGDPNGAIGALQTAVQAQPGNGIAHYHLGIAFDRLGNLKRADNEWHAATRLRPDLAEAHHALAVGALHKSDMAALDSEATQIISSQPNSPEGYAMRALANTNRKQFGQAEEDARKAIEVASQDPVGYLQMAGLRVAQQRFGEGEQLYRQALDRDPTSSDALSGLMNSYLAQKEPDKAAAAARAQIEKVPNSSAFYDLLGTLLSNTTQEKSGVEAAFKKSIELDKGNIDALIKLGQAQVAEGATDQAIATYQNSIKENPRDSRFYILAGELFESKRDLENAGQMYRKALEISPENALASNNLACVMLETGGNIDVALSLAQAARRGMPDSPNAADTLGWIFYQKGAYKASIDLMQEALRLAEKNGTPEDAEVHYHLGMAYQKLDQPHLARQQLERALKINPNYRRAAEVRKQLGQLKS